MARTSLLGRFVLLCIALPLVFGTQQPLGVLPEADHGVPSVSFETPDGAPVVHHSDGWGSAASETGFLGFTYGSDPCQPYDKLKSDFTRMRNDFKARYVRLYSWCDKNPQGYLNDVIQAAYTAGLGVYATIWFGFDGTDDWKWRRDMIVNTLKTNKNAPYVIRTIDLGSEPLFDYVMEPQALAKEINNVKSLVKTWNIPISINEMQFGYGRQGKDFSMVFDALDVVHADILPYFDTDASAGGNARTSLVNTIKWFVSQTKGKKPIILTQTGWPTATGGPWPPNSRKAVATVDSAKAYAKLLDDSCEEFKTMAPGGIGWFWHIWSDEQLGPWGLLDWNSKPKWDFHPRTAC